MFIGAPRANRRVLRTQLSQETAEAGAADGGAADDASTARLDGDTWATKPGDAAGSRLALTTEAAAPEADAAAAAAAAAASTLSGFAANNKQQAVLQPVAMQFLPGTAPAFWAAQALVQEIGGRAQAVRPQVAAHQAAPLFNDLQVYRLQACVPDRFFMLRVDLTYPHTGILGRARAGKPQCCYHLRSGPIHGAPHHTPPPANGTRTPGMLCFSVPAHTILTLAGRRRREGGQEAKAVLAPAHAHSTPKLCCALLPHADDRYCRQSGPRLRTVCALAGDKRAEHFLAAAPSATGSSRTGSLPADPVFASRREDHVACRSPFACAQPPARGRLVLR